MALTTIGLSNLTFGTTQESSVVVKSYEESLKCDPVELADGSGTFKAVAFANPNSSASITLVSSSVTAGVGAGFGYVANGVLDVDDLYIESATKTLTNDGFAEVQISAVGYLNLGQAS